MNIHSYIYIRGFFFKNIYIRVSYGIGIMSCSLLLRSTVFPMYYMCVCVCVSLLVVVVSVRFVCIQCTSHSSYITINIQHKSLLFGLPNEYMRVQCVRLCGVHVTLLFIWRWHCTMIRFYHWIQCHMLSFLRYVNQIDRKVALNAHSVGSQSTSPIKWICQIYFLSLEFDHYFAP